MQIRILVAQQMAVVRAAKIIQFTSQSYMGHPQGFWPPLKPTTIAHKMTGNSPLLETGQLKASIEITAPRVEGNTVYGVIGSSDRKALYHELGTSRIPPRPFLATAASQCAPALVEMVADMMEAAMNVGARGPGTASNSSARAASEISSAFNKLARWTVRELWAHEDSDLKREVEGDIHQMKHIGSTVLHPSHSLEGLGHFRLPQ
jgi:phage gpG-like protein